MPLISSARAPLLGRIPFQMSLAKRHFLWQQCFLPAVPVPPPRLCCCHPPCTQHPVVPRCHLSFLPLHQTKQQQSPQEDESLHKLISDTYVRNLWRTNDVQRGKQRGWIQTSQTALGDDAGICFPGVLLLPSAEHGDGHSSPDRQ